MGFPCSSVGKESAYNAGDLGSIPGLGRPMATCSSILAWRIPWTVACQAPLSMGVSRVSHDLETKLPSNNNNLAGY